MSDDEPQFNDPDKLAEWLANKTTGFGVRANDAMDAARTLQHKGCDDTDAFSTLTKESLEKDGLKSSLANKVMAKWKVWKESNGKKLLHVGVAIIVFLSSHSHDVIRKGAGCQEACCSSRSSQRGAPQVHRGGFDSAEGGQGQPWQPQCSQRT